MAALVCSDFDCSRRMIPKAPMATAQPRRDRWEPIGEIWETAERGRGGTGVRATRTNGREWQATPTQMQDTRAKGCPARQRTAIPGEGVIQSNATRAVSWITPAFGRGYEALRQARQVLPSWRANVAGLRNGHIPYALRRKDREFFAFLCYGCAIDTILRRRNAASKFENCA
jgi:hypothetical protein